MIIILVPYGSRVGMYIKLLEPPRALSPRVNTVHVSYVDMRVFLYICTRKTNLSNGHVLHVFNIITIFKCSMYSNNMIII